jgi:hypothetical protein
MQVAGLLIKNQQKFMRPLIENMRKLLISGYDRQIATVCLKD